jgi:uncharacterized protein YbjT (DUF2867 family)
MILVAGSTGGLGSEIVRLLRERGESVRGLVRKTSAPEKVSRLRDLGAEPVVGDLKDRGSLDAAVRGVKTVISTVTVITTAQEGDSFDSTDSAGNISLIDAARAAGAEHFVYISFDYSQFPSTPLTQAKASVEEHLISSGIAYTILRPSLFMDVWLGPHLFSDLSSGQAKIYGSGTGRIPYIASGDVAKVAVWAATEPSARNVVITFGGPEAISQREVVETFEDTLGKPLIVTEVPEQVLEVQWQSAQNPFEKTFAGLMLGVARLNMDDQTNDELPVETTVREFARMRAESA